MSEKDKNDIMSIIIVITVLVLFSIMIGEV